MRRLGVIPVVAVLLVVFAGCGRLPPRQANVPQSDAALGPLSWAGLARHQPQIPRSPAALTVATSGGHLRMKVGEQRSVRLRMGAVDGLSVTYAPGAVNSDVVSVDDELGGTASSPVLAATITAHHSGDVLVQTATITIGSEPVREWQLLVSVR